jgi:glutaredoxin 3
LTQLKQESSGWTLNIVDLDRMPEGDGPIVQMELLTATGQRTVPNIFIGGEHIGGNSDLQALNQAGELEALLQMVAVRNGLKDIDL